MLRILFGAQETPENVKSQFKIFEHENGAITFQSLRKACHAMGEHFTDDQIKHMLCYHMLSIILSLDQWPYDMAHIILVAFSYANLLSNNNTDRRRRY